MVQECFPENLKVSGLFDYEEKMKKGKTFIKFVSSKVNVDPELATFNFENLFDGDKQLGDNINRVINDNWKEVFDDVKDGYIDVVNRILLQLLNNFFSKVSLEEAFDWKKSTYWKIVYFFLNKNWHLDPCVSLISIKMNPFSFLDRREKKSKDLDFSGPHPGQHDRVGFPRSSVTLAAKSLKHPWDCLASAASGLGDNFSLGALKNDFAALIYCVIVEYCFG
jgi:hypothetical protein